MECNLKPIRVVALFAIVGGIALLIPVQPSFHQSIAIAEKTLPLRAELNTSQAPELTHSNRSNL